jgi:hypothetical protein
MECGKLTAKLRDAVPVCLMVNGREIRRYRNIEIPDVIKKRKNVRRMLQFLAAFLDIH